MENKIDIKSRIRTVPHFPKKGIMYRDITTLLQDHKAFRHVIREMISRFEGKKIDKVACIESRGFILGSVIAHELGVGLVIIRKPGKLPYRTVRKDYDTEYSSDGVEMHEDSVKPGDNVLLVDDLLATGGTMEAAAALVETAGGNVVGIGFIIELDYCKGRKKLEEYDVVSLVNYGSEED